WSLRKFFGFESKPETPPQSNYYATEDDDYYEPSKRRGPQQPILMRTGRTQENTSLN
ncbi:unnamed protein product, partial [Rotaria socialis]